MPTAVASWRWRVVLVTGVEISATDQKSWPAVVELGERDADTLVAAPDPTAAADELIGLDLKRECRRQADAACKLESGAACRQIADDARHPAVIERDRTALFSTVLSLIFVVRVSILLDLAWRSCGLII